MPRDNLGWVGITWMTVDDLELLEMHEMTRDGWDEKG